MGEGTRRSRSVHGASPDATRLESFNPASEATHGVTDRRDLIVEEALGLAGRAREEFLAIECHGDEALRQEVEELLAIDASNDGAGGAEAVRLAIDGLRVLSVPNGERSVNPAVVPAPPQVKAGQSLGRYIVRREIGRGGMSRVYEAEDAAIERPVALKLLSTGGTDTAGRSRFFQELRLLGRVQHDHIVRVYDFGEHDGALYLVMELLEGEDLAASLTAERTGTLERRIDIAVQIGHAVRQIHRAGIVHRDIKPANVFLESSGRAKLLDFGIAHHGSLVSGATIIGTAEYLAPEQIRGRATPASDAYAYGVLLFELFTGNRPFTGGDLLEILWKVAFECVPVEPLLAARVPDSLVRLILDLTAKDPLARPDFDTAIACLQAVVASRPWSAERAGVLAEMPPRPRRPRSSMFWLSAVAAAGVAGAAYAWYGGAVYRGDRLGVMPAVAGVVAPEPRNAARSIEPNGPPTPPSAGLRDEARSIHLSIDLPKQLTFRGVADTELAVSPDGRRVVFRAASADGTRPLCVRSLDSLTLSVLPDSDYGRFPFWSPDGRAIAFFAYGKLKRINLPDGPTRIISEAANAKGGSWNRDGTIIYAPWSGEHGLYAISADGGVPRQITRVDPSRREEAHVWPSFLPNGRHFLYAIRGGDASGAGTYVQALLTGSRTRLLPITSNVSYADGHLLFSNADVLLARRFNLDDLTLTGEPYAVATAIRTFSNRADFSAAGPVLGYWRDQPATSDIAWIARTGHTLQTRPAPVQVGDPDLSPDGRTLAFSSEQDIWTLDCATGNRSRMTSTSSAEHYPIWSPDGQHIAFSSDRPGSGLYQVERSTGRQTALLALGDVLYPTDWSRDGSYIVFERKNARTKARDVWVLPRFGDEKPFPVAATDADERQGQISPDNRWIAYSSNTSGHWQVEVVPLGGGLPAQRISPDGGVQPEWGPNGNELFYLYDNQLMVTRIPGASPFDVGTPRPLFRVDVANLHPRRLYSVTADGQRFLFITSPPRDPELITMVMNWSALRRAR